MTGRQDETAKTEAEQHAALDRVLDTFGADPARWPEADRASLSTWIASSPEAGRRLHRAAAFDRLLDQARLPVGAGESGRTLADRIMAAAAAESGSAPAGKAGAAVVPLRPRRPARNLDWTIAAVMAASLAIGFVAGSKGIVAPDGGVDSSSALAEDTDDETIVALGDDIDADDDSSAEDL